MSRCVLIFSVAAISGFRLFAQSEPDKVLFFEKSVKPVFAANCAACHNQQLKTSGLALDSRKDLLTGGNRGASVKPGSPGESVLFRAIEQTGDLKMPPGRKLNDEAIAAVRKWIEDGASWTAEAAPTKARGADHWAFQPPKRTAPPAVKNAAWVRNPIDRFVLARLEQEGLAPSPEADRLTLLRRVSLDLTGLPPTTNEIAAFVADTSPMAYEKAVDRLLASSHYGERWGRNWLDLARYADSDGYTIDDPRQIWLYRDWVIKALNDDMPFDRFVIEQIAGDMLPNATVSQMIATGFHRNTALNYEGGIDFEQYRVEAVADRVATTGAAFLGLTLGCARCHDHKYDPISQREFYQLLAYFNSTDEITTEAEREQYDRPVLEVPTAQDIEKVKAHRAKVDALNRELVSHVRALAAKPAAPDDPPKHNDKTLVGLMGKLRQATRNEPRVTSTLVMRELPRPREAYIHLNGDFTRRGATVTPDVPAILKSKPIGTTRLDLARWLVDPSNPLTARVTVNRMWQTYFGKGLVESESDFGLAGSQPTHPELLDWLALEFMNSRPAWSQKAVHRLIVTSAAYRQSSRSRRDLEEKDPYNNLLARQSRFRLEAEAIRDGALVASGMLTPTVGGPSVFPPIPINAMSGTQLVKPWPTAFGPDRYRRGLYTFTYRASLHPALSLFDAPDAAAACTRRVRSNTPLQALTLLNDTAHTEFARGFARRIDKEGGASDRSRIEFAFLAALGRRPQPAETERMLRFLAVQRDEYASNPKSASVLIANEPGGDARAMLEAEAAAKPRAGGNQSAQGRAAVNEFVTAAKAELEIAKKSEESRVAIEPARVPELAAWTAVARVLLNLDDFMTRN
jgi:hypothetical protein